VRFAGKAIRAEVRDSARSLPIFLRWVCVRTHFNRVNCLLFSKTIPPSSTSSLSDFGFREWKALFEISVDAGLEHPRRIASLQLREGNNYDPVQVLELRKLYNVHLSLRWAIPKLDELASKSTSLDWLEAKRLSIVDLTLLLHSREVCSHKRYLDHWHRTRSKTWSRSDVLNEVIWRYRIQDSLNTLFYVITETFW
jgi:hypothetical protein